MLADIRALIFVAAIAAATFHLAKPLALQFMSADDFFRRRRAWFILTIACFLSPNFWFYTLVAAPTLVWANRRESNPIALYMLLLHVAPPVGAIIPLFGDKGLFYFDNNRLLALCILLPAAVRYRRNPELTAGARIGAMDLLLLAFVALQIALYVPPDFPHHAMIPDSVTNVVRRLILFPLDVYLLYFAVSRTCRSRRAMVEVAGALCLACGIMAATAVFESLRGWLLYTDIASRWGGDPHAAFYLVRAGVLRAQVSAGHSIALGNILAVGFGFWLYLKSQVLSAKYRFGVTVLLWGGLYATSSRGAWLGASAIYFTFLAAGPRAASRLTKGALLSFALAGLIVVSPIGERILEMLPHSGAPADQYRHRLAERGWELVFQHPLFGDQYPWPEMEDLRQGEGIIDIVNTYLGVALNYGLVGLLCFLSFILLGVKSVYAGTRQLVSSDPDLALFGASLIACIVGVLIMIDSNSFALGCEKLFYALAGLATAYARTVGSQLRRPVGFDIQTPLQD